MKMEFKDAEQKFFEGDYLKAFDLFKNITQNNLSSNYEKSDAYNMMGAIVLTDTRVQFQDESGLEYFIKSLEYNSENIGALLNIIEGFGTSINNHRNVKIFDFALKQLQHLNYDFSLSAQTMIDKKLKIRDKICKSNSNII